MTEDSLKFQISQSNNATLKAVYEHCCEEYRRRLCEMWELGLDYSWWVVDRPGDVLCLNDVEYSLSMDDVRYFVDGNISYSDFAEWWDYNLEESYKGENARCINCYSWFINNARPKDYEKEV